MDNVMGPNNIVKDTIRSKARQHAKRAIKHVVPKRLVPPALRGEGLTDELMRYSTLTPGWVLFRRHCLAKNKGPPGRTPYGMPESALQYVPQAPATGDQFSGRVSRERPGLQI